jgi:RNA polymerase sigma-70 factor (TIGR02957 family)
VKLSAEHPKAPVFEFVRGKFRDCCLAHGLTAELSISDRERRCHGLEEWCVLEVEYRSSVPDRLGVKVNDGATSELGPDTKRVFNEHRDLLFSVAYRILGSVADAEDAVQEAWLRWSGVDPTGIANPRAFLVRVITHLAIDRLRREQARRESYVGPWLPEPVLTAPDVAEDVALAESVSMAMLVVLETLSPLERAVFVLREAFGMPYAEIAEILDRKEEAVRQLARRARDHVQERKPRFEADQATRRRVTERFLEATSSGDLETLMRVLAPGVTLVADGGGRALAPRRPVRGAEKVARFLIAVATEERTARFLRSVEAEPSLDVRVHLAHINDGPGVVVSAGGRPISALVLDVAGGLVRTIHLVANPEKLAGLRGTGKP